MSLVPVIASAKKRNQIGFMHSNINLAMRYASLISIPCAVGMSVLAEPIMLLFYPFQKEAAVSAAGSLQILAYGIIFLGLTHALTGILQGIGKQMLPVRNLAIGALAKTLVTYTLTGIPSLNIRGAAIGTVTAYLVSALLDFISMRKHTGTAVEYRKAFIMPAISSAVMGAVVVISYRGLRGGFGNAMSTMVSIIIGVAVYGFMIFVTKAVTIDELRKIPKIGRTLGKLMDKAARLIRK